MAMFIVKSSVVPISFKQKCGWLATPIVTYKSWLMSKLVLLLFAYHLEVCASIESPVTQDKMAYHLHLILGVSNAVTTCTSVTLLFPLGVRLCPKKYKKL